MPYKHSSMRIRAFLVSTYWDKRVGLADSLGTESQLLDLSLCTALSACAFVSFVINGNSKYIILLGSVNHSSELPNRRRESWEPSNLELTGQKCGQLGHPFDGRCLKWRQSCGTESLTGGFCADSGWYPI